MSSPTLAQGLNLSATSIVMHDISHYRGNRRKTIPAAEFKNIVGRAGRAFVDVEGLVLYPIYENHIRRQREWRNLLQATVDQELESGLFLLLQFFLNRLYNSLNRPDI